MDTRGMRQRLLDRLAVREVVELREELAMAQEAMTVAEGKIKALIDDRDRWKREALNAWEILGTLANSECICLILAADAERAKEESCKPNGVCSACFAIDALGRITK